MAALTEEGEDGGVSVESQRGRQTPVLRTGQIAVEEEEEASDGRGVHVGK
jgi:hypothetical protein